VYNETFEAYETMRGLEEANSSTFGEEFGFFLAALLFVLICTVGPVLIVRRFRSKRRPLRTWVDPRGPGRP